MGLIKKESKIKDLPLWDASTLKIDTPNDLDNQIIEMTKHMDVISTAKGKNLSIKLSKLRVARSIIQRTNVVKAVPNIFGFSSTLSKALEHKIAAMSISSTY